MPPGTREKNFLQISEGLPSSPTLAKCTSTKSWPPLGTHNKWCFGHIHVPVFFFIICGCEVFDIRPKVILTGNRHPFVTSGQHLRSVGRYMCSKVPLISVRGLKIFCWKLGRSCYFGSNGPTYTFSFSFLYSALFHFF